MKMEQTVFSETLAFKLQDAGEYLSRKHKIKLQTTSYKYFEGVKS
jgi:hypothetical protein